MRKLVGICLFMSLWAPTTVFASPASECIAQGEAQLAAQSWQPALEQFNSCLNQDPNMTAAQLGKIRALIQLNELDQALPITQAMIQKLPNCDECYAQLTAIYEKKGEWLSGLDAAHKALELNPQSASAHYYYGMLLYDQGIYDEAADAFKKAIDANPDLPDGYMLLGMAAEKDGKTKVALAAYKKAISVSPDKARAHRELGRIYLERDQNARALQELTSSLELKRSDYEAHYLMGKVLLKLSREEKAIESFEKSIELNPDFLPTYEALEPMYEKRGDWPLALRAYEKIAKRDEVFEVAHLGYLYLKAEEYDKAQRMFEQAIEMNPEDPLHYYNLGLAHRMKEEWPEAIEQYQKAIAISPEDPDAHFSLALAYCKNHNFQEALQAVQLSRQLQAAQADDLYKYIAQTQCISESIQPIAKPNTQKPAVQHP